LVRQARTETTQSWRKNTKQIQKKPQTFRLKMEVIQGATVALASMLHKLTVQSYTSHLDKLTSQTTALGFHNLKIND